MKSNKTRSSKKVLRKTIRRKPVSIKKNYIVRKFIEMINVVKLYHWKTHSYAEHKATDELYGKLNENVDKFVEVLLGKDESRIQQWDKKMEIMQSNDHKQFKDKIHEYRRFLIDLNECLNPRRDSDLISIRDDILSDINQFLYLFTFNK
jgi:DNA-binding ferritin-like protein